MDGRLMYRLWMALLLLVACAAKHAERRGSAEIVTDADGLTAHAGTIVDVKGTAQDAKLGASIVVTNNVVYCVGLERWRTDMVGQPVTAHGTLEQTSELAAPDPTSAGTSGPVWVLRGCTYQPSP